MNEYAVFLKNSGGRPYHIREIVAPTEDVAGPKAVEWARNAFWFHPDEQWTLDRIQFVQEAWQ